MFKQHSVVVVVCITVAGDAVLLDEPGYDMDKDILVAELEMLKDTTAGRRPRAGSPWALKSMASFTKSFMEVNKKFKEIGDHAEAVRGVPEPPPEQRARTRKGATADSRRKSRPWMRSRRSSVRADSEGKGADPAGRRVAGRTVSVTRSSEGHHAVQVPCR
ncbi:hypothetical protein Btru_059973 [Bulinus truncatus]|nr:hypothetical protein Btru_059973 [Bulinus truncatus]